MQLQRKTIGSKFKFSLIKEFEEIFHSLKFSSAAASSNLKTAYCFEKSDFFNVKTLITPLEIVPNSSSRCPIIVLIHF